MEHIVGQLMIIEKWNIQLAAGETLWGGVVCSASALVASKLIEVL